MNEEVIKQISKLGGKLEILIEKLSTELGVASEELMRLMMKQAYVEGISHVFLILTLIPVGYVLYRSLLAARRELNKEWHEEHEQKGVACVIVAIFAAIYNLTILLNAIFVFKKMVTCFVNPKYWALQEILIKLSSIGG